MNKFILVGAAGALLAACSASQVASGESDIQAVVTDGQEILATGLIPQPAAGIAALVLAGIKAVDNSVTTATTASASAESTSITGLETAVQQAMADTSNAGVQAGGAAALRALGALSATSSASAVTQAEAAAGALLIDYLQSKAPATARYGAKPSSIQGLIDDAHTHLTALGH